VPTLVFLLSCLHSQLEHGTDSLACRFAVVNVMERCRSQLIRVFNTDILVQKVHSVLEKSIDPIARSLALRAFASMAELLVNNLRVHSQVRNALRSPNTMEQTACTLCVQQLSEHSPSFAQGSVGLVGRLVTALETPMNQRLQLIAILQHMHRDPATVLESRRVLQEVIERMRMCIYMYMFIYI